MKALLKAFLPAWVWKMLRAVRRGMNPKLAVFKLFERFGLHVYPMGYYSPMPDTRELLRTKQQWLKESDFSKISFNREEEAYLNDTFSNYQKEFESLPSFADLQSKGYGPGYGEIEALLLHCFIRHFQPGKIIEVGSGVSTFFSGNALSMNKKEGKDSRLICIEPYPYQRLREIPFVSDIIEKKVQEVDIDFFSQLSEGDILFLDSSHTVKIGSDVNYLILEVLPSLNKGVLVHIHDIPFPYTFPYPDFWIFERLMFWQEPVLLKAFLTNNGSFEVIYCSSCLHFKNPAVLRRTFPVYDSTKHFPSSIWLRKLA